MIKRERERERERKREGLTKEESETYGRKSRMYLLITEFSGKQP